MNSEGSFTAIVSVILLLLIAAIGLTYYAMGSSQNAMLKQQNALELKQHWTNVRQLLDAAAGDALLDADSSKNCAIEVGEDYSGKVKEYFNDVNKSVSSTNSSKCLIPDLPLVNASNNSEFFVTLSCEKTGSVSYSSEIVFKKSLNGPPCAVTDI